MGWMPLSSPARITIRSTWNRDAVGGDSHGTLSIAPTATGTLVPPLRSRFTLGDRGSTAELGGHMGDADLDLKTMERKEKEKEEKQKAEAEAKQELRMARLETSLKRWQIWSVAVGILVAILGAVFVVANYRDNRDRTELQRKELDLAIERSEPDVAVQAHAQQADDGRIRLAIRYMNPSGTSAPIVLRGLVARRLGAEESDRPLHADIRISPAAFLSPPEGGSWGHFDLLEKAEQDRREAGGALRDSQADLRDPDFGVAIPAYQEWGVTEEERRRFQEVLGRRSDIRLDGGLRIAAGASEDEVWGPYSLSGPVSFEVRAYTGSACVGARTKPAYGRFPEFPASRGTPFRCGFGRATVDWQDSRDAGGSLVDAAPRTVGGDQPTTADGSVPPAPASSR
jgi:hypothetical protein